MSQIIHTENNYPKVQAQNDLAKIETENYFRASKDAIVSEPIHSTIKHLDSILRYVKIGDIRGVVQERNGPFFIAIDSNHYFSIASQSMKILLNSITNRFSAGILVGRGNDGKNKIAVFDEEVAIFYIEAYLISRTYQRQLPITSVKFGLKRPEITLDGLTYGQKTGNLYYLPKKIRTQHTNISYNFIRYDGRNLVKVPSESKN